MRDEFLKKIRHSPGGNLSLAALTEEFRPALLRYFSRRLSNQSEIEDLVQDVFLRLLNHQNVTEMEGARGYVFETANSVFVDWLRKSRTRRADRHDPFDPQHHGSTDFEAERVLSGREELARATAILMELPERTRVIFVLRRIEGMKYKDIARHLGISVSAVEKNVSRAMSYLMERLDDEEV
jgi:RNA polymerase sigma-70 factor (ECF subfamily)